MNADGPPMPDPDPVDRACRVDSICDAFEAAWREGRAPRLEDYLKDGDASARCELLDALFAVEFSYRVRRGDRARVEDYQDRFSGDLERFARIASDVARDRTVAHYQVLQRLGFGSFASVYLALDTRLHRTVALKLSHGHWNDQAEAIFTREAKAAAQLDHPHIVPVFDFGRHDDTMFIAAQHVPGPSLKEWQRGRPVGGAEATLLCARLAAAVHHAHQRGVIHRDLKPANIIIDPQGEPHITDFGLAKWADDATLTGTGDLKGTPAYMSPEQARGNARDVTIQSDVYALGVILYELLTASRPFDGLADEVLRRVMTEAPRPPRQLNATIPRDLEVVCLKALAKEPQQRYATAHDFAEDLWRVARGEPIEARPVGLVARFLLWRRREPRLAAAMAVAVALLCALGCGMLYWNWSISAARNEASKNLHGTELLAVVLARMIDANDPLGAHTTGLAGPQLAGFAFGQQGEAAARLGGVLDELSAALEGRLLDRPQARARLLEAVANGYRGLGRTADARPLYLEAIELRQLIPEERTRQLAVANTQFYLGWLELEEGNPAEAQSSFKDVAQTRSRWLGNQRHADVIAAQAGILAAMMADDDGSRDLLNDGWRLLTELHAAGGDSLTVAAVHDYPDLRSRQTTSLSRYDELLANARGILGDEHPVLAMLLIDAAGRHREAGDYRRAEQWIGQALPMARRFFGAHPKLMQPARDFAASLAAQGDFDRALVAYRDALQIADRRQPENHSLRAELMLRLGEVQRESGHCRRAAEEFARALDLLGPAADPASAGSVRDTLLLRVAEAHLDLGEPDAARPYVAELMPRLDGPVAPAAGSRWTAASARLPSVATLLRRLGADADADRLDARARQLAEEQHGQMATLAPDECAGVAAVLARHQRWEASVEMRKRALTGARGAASGQPAVASGCRELAMAMIRLAKHECADDVKRAALLGEAQRLLKEALEIRRRCHGIESHYVAELLLDGAQLQLVWGQPTLARAEAIRALVHRRQLHDGPHILTARAVLEVSRLLAEAGDTAQAELLAQEGHGLLQKLLPSTHAELREAELAPWLAATP